MEDFVPFEIAKKLKEKGFREKCIGYYDYSEEFHYNYESAISNKEIYFCHNKYDNIWHRDLIDAPTISQVLKWLREEKKIFILIGLSMCGYRYDVQNNIRISRDYADMYNWDNVYLNGEARFYKSYEQAALAGIEYVIDNLP